jgi:hypothetical protein
MISKHFGPNKIYGIELSLFDLDHLDMAINDWEIIGAKIAIKIFGCNLIIAGLEISDGRASICVLNCFLTVFWG